MCDDKPPQLIRPINYPDLVRVALAFDDLRLVPFGEDYLMKVIMSALGGKANPVVLREEIKKQRG